MNVGNYSIDETYMGNGGSPIAGWFISENPIVRNGWWLGVPPWLWKSPDGPQNRGSPTTSPTAGVFHGNSENKTDDHMITGGSPISGNLHVGILLMDHGNTIWLFNIWKPQTAQSQRCLGLQSPVFVRGLPFNLHDDSSIVLSATGHNRSNKSICLGPSIYHAWFIHRIFYSTFFHGEYFFGCQQLGLRDDKAVCKELGIQLDFLDTHHMTWRFNIRSIYMFMYYVRIVYYHGFFHHILSHIIII